jgi:hypothetical protein
MTSPAIGMQGQPMFDATHDTDALVQVRDLKMYFPPYRQCESGGRRQL